MAHDRITFSLAGEVTLGNFRTAISSFTNLMEMLTAQANPESKVEWIISDLRFGSATITVRGEVEERDEVPVVEEVVESAEEIGKLASVHDFKMWTTYPRAIRDEVATMFGMLNGRIPTATLGPYTIDAPVAVDPPIGIEFNIPRREHTSIKGKIVTLDNKRGTYFTLREAFTNRLIRCWPTLNYRDQIAALWKSEAWVLVEGSYNTFTEKPTMTDITEIIPLGTAEKGGWKKVFGISPRGPGDSKDSVADIVRKVRDGG